MTARCFILNRRMAFSGTDRAHKPDLFMPTGRDLKEARDYRSSKKWRGHFRLPSSRSQFLTHPLLHRRQARKTHGGSCPTHAFIPGFFDFNHRRGSQSNRRDLKHAGLSRHHGSDYESPGSARVKHPHLPPIIQNCLGLLVSASAVLNGQIHRFTAHPPQDKCGAQADQGPCGGLGDGGKRFTAK